MSTRQLERLENVRPNDTLWLARVSFVRTQPGSRDNTAEKIETPEPVSEAGPPLEKPESRDSTPEKIETPEPVSEAGPPLEKPRVKAVQKKLVKKKSVKPKKKLKK